MKGKLKSVETKRKWLIFCKTTCTAPLGIFSHMKGPLEQGYVDFSKNRYNLGPGGWTDIYLPWAIREWDQGCLGSD